jgi:hypothetical protein
MMVAYNSDSIYKSANKSPLKGKNKNVVNLQFTQPRNAPIGRRPAKVDGLAGFAVGPNSGQDMWTKLCALAQGIQNMRTRNKQQVVG